MDDAVGPCADDGGECEADYECEVAEEIWGRELARRRAVNKRLEEAGCSPAVLPARPEHRDAVRYLAEALRVGNDALEAELSDSEPGFGGRAGRLLAGLAARRRGLGGAADRAEETDAG